MVSIFPEVITDSTTYHLSGTNKIEIQMDPVKWVANNTATFPGPPTQPTASIDPDPAGASKIVYLGFSLILILIAL